LAEIFKFESFEWFISNSMNSKLSALRSDKTLQVVRERLHAREQ
jgi:hypothetical protein